MTFMHAFIAANLHARFSSTLVAMLSGLKPVTRSVGICHWLAVSYGLIYFAIERDRPMTITEQRDNYAYCEPRCVSSCKGRLWLARKS
jgi:hypothetical protein